MLKKSSGAGDDDPPEVDLRDWVIRVTRPREAARRAELKEAAYRKKNAGASGGRNRGERVGERAGANDPAATAHHPQDICNHFSSSRSRITVTPGKNKERPNTSLELAGRCPKCTLVVPCLHFASVQSLMEEFPEGVPEWRWNRPKAHRRAPTRNQKVVRDHLVENNGMGIEWWKDLHQAQRRCRVPEMKPSAGIVNAAQRKQTPN